MRQAKDWQIRNKFGLYYQDTGALRRSLYKKHTEFMAAGRWHRERAFIAGNRTGKTEVACYEGTAHLTGEYPDWWEGHRFNRPINAWAAGDTLKTTKEILQAKLLGKEKQEQGGDPLQPVGIGTGMIPAEHIIKVTANPHVAGGILSVAIRHKPTGGISTLAFKSYDQGRRTFQGTEQDLILLDEEPPPEVYSECLLRTMATGSFEGGWMISTFTPLSGWSEVVMQFLNEKARREAGRYVVTAGWDDAPHLSEKEKAELLSKIPAHEREARTTGTPSVGQGAIYPILDSDLAVNPFKVPDHWPRIYGLDVGWNKTACVWGALDRDNDVLYLTDEYYRGEVPISVHADAIKARGEWIPGAIDPASSGSSVTDGEKAIAGYRARGLNLVFADNTVEAGIQEVFDRMSTGRLRVFRSLTNWFEEKRLYRREKNKVVKEKDHLQDATRYLVSKLSSAKTRPAPKPKFTPKIYSGDRSWMA